MPNQEGLTQDFIVVVDRLLKAGARPAYGHGGGLAMALDFRITPVIPALVDASSCKDLEVCQNMFAISTI